MEPVTVESVERIMKEYKAHQLEMLEGRPFFWTGWIGANKPDVAVEHTVEKHKTALGKLADE